MRRWPLLFSLLFVLRTPADTLTVGPARQFATIEQANQAARAGDTIEVYPPESGVYQHPAVYVTKSGLRLVGKSDNGARIVLDGTGGDYSGAGAVPRAIFQINRGADGVVIENFELRNARNGSHNAAGVRINQACRVTIRRCDIHHNQMGIMSNGAANDAAAAAEQLVEFCTIHENGDAADPGYNHNLYLGGTSVTVQCCEIYAALTGHNVKSRAHFNFFQYNYVHDSANREFDLVDAWDTTRPDAHAVLLANFIVKRDPCAGNTNVIHFGRDGSAEHDGTLYLLNNTVVTPHYGPVIQLSSARARAHLVNNIIYNPRESAPRLYELRGGIDPRVITGDGNWISRRYDLSATGLDAQSTFRDERRDGDPGFVDPAKRDFRLMRASAARWRPDPAPEYRDGAGRVIKGVLDWQFRSVAEREKRGGEGPCYIGAGVDEWPLPTPTTDRSGR